MTQFLDEGRAPVVIDSAFHASDPVPVTGTVTVSGITLEMSDIQIGAVEIKDATTNDRAAVSAAGELSVSLGAAVVTADTELPAAVTLAENTANPTVPGVASFGMIYNAVDDNWDRLLATELQSDHVAGFDEQAPVSYSLVAGINGAILRRVHAPSDFDGLDLSTDFYLSVSAANKGYNGSTWDRLRSRGSTVESFTGDALGVLQTGALLYGYDNAFGTWERARVIRSTEADGIDNDSFNRSLVTQSVIRGLNAIGDYDRIRGTAANGLEVDVTRIQGGITVSGTTTVDTELPDPITLGDTLSNPTITAAGVYLLGWDDDDGHWERVRMLRRADLDGRDQAFVDRALFTNTVLRGVRAGAGNDINLDRIRSDGNDADALATETLGILNVNSFLRGYNGATWDRLTVDGNKNLNVTLATALDSSDDSVSIGSGVTVLRAPIAASGLSNVLVPAVSGEKIKVLSMLIMVSGTVFGRFESGGGTDLTGDLPFDALGAGFVLAPPAATDMHHFESLVGEALNLELSSAVYAGGYLTYYTEA